MERTENLSESPEIDVDLSSIKDKMPSELENPAEHRQFMARLEFVFTTNEFSDLERKAFVLHLKRATTPGVGGYKWPADVLTIFYHFSCIPSLKSDLRRLLKDDIETIKLVSF